MSSPLVAPEFDEASGMGGPASPVSQPSTPDGFPAILASETTSAIAALTPSDLERHAQFVDSNPGRIHRDLDRPTLARLRNRLDRDLTESERKEYRRAFAAALTGGAQ